MNILILGGAGQLGLELQRHAWPAGVNLCVPSRAEVDIASEAALEACLGAGDWGAVINAAAFTDVENAETSSGEAWRINALAPALIALGAARRDAALVHVSTDYVFDGACGPYREDDRVNPLNAYGASKEAGERAVRHHPRHAIVRTSWLFSAHRRNFVRTMLRLARERDVIDVVDDQRGCPTSAADLAGAIVAIALSMARRRDAPTGDFHAVNAGEATWCGFARAIMHGATQRGAPSAEIRAITTFDHGSRTRRPPDSRLAVTRLPREFGVTMRPWQEALNAVLDEILGPRSTKEPST